MEPTISYINKYNDIIWNNNKVYLKNKHSKSLEKDYKYIATFYGWYKFHQGVRELIKDKEYSKYYKIYLSSTGKSTSSFNLNAQVFINKEYF